MAKYRKKPIVVEAEQFLVDWPNLKGVNWEESEDSGFFTPYVVTIHEQRAYLEYGDWVIPEPKPDRYYPCKPDIFAATYERVGE